MRFNALHERASFDLRAIAARCSLRHPAFAVERVASAKLAVLNLPPSPNKKATARVAVLFGGGGGNRTRVRRFYVPGSTCIARCLISSRGNTTCEAHRRTSRLRV